jgi:hypothetical protein
MRAKCHINNIGQRHSSKNCHFFRDTTKTTTGTALAAHTKRTLTLSTTLSDLKVVAGDRLRVRVAATGTLANTVAEPVFTLRFAWRL